MIYLDNAATTPIAPEVLEAMMPYLAEEYANPGGLYASGRRAREAVEHARQQCADAIGAKPEQIIFTSGGTEANVLAIQGIVPYLSAIGRTTIVTSPLEHKSVLTPISTLESTGEFSVIEVLPPRSGRCIFGGDIRRAMADSGARAGLVSIMTVNNELGDCNEVPSIAQDAHRAGALFHTDCVQGFPQMVVDVVGWDVDFLSVSAHKFHGPKGAGFLYVREKDLLFPVIPGGGQEEGLRGGTENVPAIVGMGAAAELRTKNLERDIQHCRRLGAKFFSQLLTETADHKLRCDALSYGEYRIFSLHFPGVDAETLILLLDEHGIQVSAGAACSSHESEPSHVLIGIGMTAEEARQTIRVSISPQNTEEEIERAAHEIFSCAKFLQESI